MVITVGKKSCKLIIVTNEEYGLLGKPLKKSIVTTKKGEIEYAQIKKENVTEKITDLCLKLMEAKLKE